MFNAGLLPAVVAQADAWGWPVEAFGKKFVNQASSKWGSYPALIGLTCRPRPFSRADYRFRFRACFRRGQRRNADSARGWIPSECSRRNGSEVCHDF